MAIVVGALCAAPVAAAKPGDVFVGLNSGGVVRISPNGTPTGAQSLAGSGSPFTSNGGGDFGTNGLLYTSDYGLTGIIKLNPRTHSASTLSSSMLFSSVSDVEFAPDGRLYASDFGASTIYRVNRKTGATSVLTSGGKFVGSTYALAVGPSGEIFAADYSGRVVRINPRNAHQKLISTDPDLGSPIGIAASANGKRIFVLDSSSQEVTRINLGGPVASNATVITNGADLISGAYDLTWTLKGKLLTVNDTDPGKIIQIDPNTGNESIVYSGDLLHYAEGLTVEPPKCGGKVVTLYGTSKRDVIKGSPYNDVIAGLGGNDTIKGLGGKDILCGNAGRDKLIGGPGRDVTRQ